MASLYLSKHKKKAHDIDAAVIFEDEASFRQDSTLHQTWGRRGVQPEVLITGQRKSVKVFGSIEIRSAKFIFYRETVFNASTYLDYLEILAKKYFRRKVFLIQDNASYHKDGLVWLWFKDNRKWLEVYLLPPYSPDFNASEFIWRYTRRNGTHNRYFVTEAELVATIEAVFKKIQSNPNEIMGYLNPFL